jgi:hypothetical protein
MRDLKIKLPVDVYKNLGDSIHAKMSDDFPDCHVQVCNGGAIAAPEIQTDDGEGMDLIQRRLLVAFLGSDLSMFKPVNAGNEEEEDPAAPEVSFSKDDVLGMLKKFRTNINNALDDFENSVIEQ